MKNSTSNENHTARRSWSRRQTQSFRRSGNNIAELLEELSSLHPDRAVLIEGSGRKLKSISYGEFARRVSEKAALLDSHGLRSSDVVLMLESLSIELYVSILAIFRLGAVALMVDASAGLKTIERAVSVLNPQAVLASDKGLLAALSLSSVRKLSLKFVDGCSIPAWKSLKHSSEPCAPSTRPARSEPVSPSHPALITFTSGTTGSPKAIVRSHEFLRAQLSVLQKNVGGNEGSCELTSLPIFVLANIASSITTVLPDANMSNLDQLNVDGLLEQMRICRSDRILGSPALIEQIAAGCRKRGLTFPFIKKVITGGGPVFPHLVEQARRVFPQAEIVIVYGSSEAEPIAKLRFDELSSFDLESIKEGAGLPVGKAVGEVDVRILPILEGSKHLEDSDQLATLRHICEAAEISIDQVGEIIVSGDHVVKGYFNDTGDPGTKLSINGEIWHRTGDVGYIDRKGRIWLTGRLPANSVGTNVHAESAPGASALKWRSRGAASPTGDGTDLVENVSAPVTLFAQCIEAAVLSQKEIRGAACLRTNNTTIVFIESSETGKDIDPWSIKERLGWSQTRQIKFVQKIPRDKRHNSKVLYEKLLA